MPDRRPGASLCAAVASPVVLLRLAVLGTAWRATGGACQQGTGAGGAAGPAGLADSARNGSDSAGACGCRVPPRGERSPFGSLLVPAAGVVARPRSRRSACPRRAMSARCGSARSRRPTACSVFFVRTVKEMS